MFTSPNEVKITKDANLIQDQYERSYEGRYKTKPFVETDDLVVFAFLSKNFGLERGKAIVSHYVTMNDEWFAKQAHNPRTLRKDVHKVIADLGVKESRGATNASIQFQSYMSCGKCGATFVQVGKPTGSDILCPNCS